MLKLLLDHQIVVKFGGKLKLQLWGKVLVLSGQVAEKERFVLSVDCLLVVTEGFKCTQGDFIKV